MVVPVVKLVAKKVTVGGQEQQVFIPRPHFKYSGAKGGGATFSRVASNVPAVIRKNVVRELIACRGAYRDVKLREMRSRLLSETVAGWLKGQKVSPLVQSHVSEESLVELASRTGETTQCGQTALHHDGNTSHGYVRIEAKRIREGVA